MSRYIIRVFTAILCFVILAGCAPTGDNAEKSSIAELLKYKDSYVGDNSAVGNILHNLDGGQFVTQFALQTGKEPYGIEITYGPKDDSPKNEFNEYWTEETIQKTFFGTATSLFALIKNVDYIDMTIETGEKKALTITRADLETYYGEDIRTFAESEQAWKENITENPSNTSDRIQSFFEEHVITP